MRGSVLGAATTHHATVALSTARRRWRAALRVDGKRRQLGFEFASVAARTLGFLLAEEDGLEHVSALLTAVFKNRHRDSNQFPGNIESHKGEFAHPNGRDDKTIIDAGN